MMQEYTDNREALTWRLLFSFLFSVGSGEDRFNEGEKSKVKQDTAQYIFSFLTS